MADKSPELSTQILLVTHSYSMRFLSINREFKIYDATVAKTSLKISSLSLSIFLVIREFKIYDATAAKTPQILHI